MTRGEYIADFIDRMPHWIRRKAVLGPEGIGIDGRLYRVEPCSCGAETCLGWTAIDPHAKPRLRVVST